MRPTALEVDLGPPCYCLCVCVCSLDNEDLHLVGVFAQNFAFSGRGLDFDSTISEGVVSWFYLHSFFFSHLYIEQLQEEATKLSEKEAAVEIP